MNLLIDTHALIWALALPERLSPAARHAIAEPDNTVIVSAVTAYEIEFKRHRDSFLRALPLDLERAVGDLGFAWRPIAVSDCLAAGRLPRLHGDPWDRLLVAQALNLGAAVVTADRAIPAYGATTLW
ncbi:MAG: type II toxin-antitoxin system VapC family toxin [Hyphomonadaceae bacterium]|nr:type II toxin-antitoxin system VapC family toxin [Hyphomonadaceae bacterium]